jgi:hypothetical protein
MKNKSADLRISPFYLDIEPWLFADDLDEDAVG